MCWEGLGAAWMHSERSSRRVGVSWVNFGRFQAPFDSILGRLGGVLGVLGKVLGLIFGGFGRPKACQKDVQNRVGIQ